jgi:uncharacterized protein (TIGR03086 family)
VTLVAGSRSPKRFSIDTGYSQLRRLAGRCCASAVRGQRRHARVRERHCEDGELNAAELGEIPHVARRDGCDARRMSISAPASSSIDIAEIHQRAGLATRVFVAGVAADQWSAPTNCDMNVRALVNHLVSGNLWTVELVAGKTIAEVGTRLDGDMLVDDPLAAYDSSLSAAHSAFDGRGALQAICHVSYGDVPAEVYCSHRILDSFIHGWDIARATGQDSTLDPELVDIVYAMFKPQTAMLQAGGAFGQPVDVPADSDKQTLLLALLGRDNRA